MGVAKYKGVWLTLSGCGRLQGVWLTLSVEALSLMTVPVFLKAVDVFSPMAFTFSFSLGREGEIAVLSKHKSKRIHRKEREPHLMRVPALEMAPEAFFEPSDSVVTVFW